MNKEIPDLDFFEDIEQSLQDVGVRTTSPVKEEESPELEMVDSPVPEEKMNTDASELETGVSESGENDTIQECEKRTFFEKLKDLLISVISFAGSAIRALLYGNPEPDMGFWKDTKRFVEAQNMRDHIMPGRNGKNKETESVQENLQSHREPDTKGKIEPEINKSGKDEITREDEGEVTQVLGSFEKEESCESEVKPAFACALQAALKDNGFSLEQQPDGEFVLWRTPVDGGAAGEKHVLDIDNILQGDVISADSLATILCQLHNQKSGVDSLTLPDLDKANIAAAYESLAILTCATVQADMMNRSVNVSIPMSTGRVEGHTICENQHCTFCVDDKKENVEYSSLIGGNISELAGTLANSWLEHPQSKTFSIELSEEQNITANISYMRGDPHFTVNIVENGNVIPLADGKAYLAVEDQGPSQNPKKTGNTEPTLNTFRRDLKSQMSQLEGKKLYSASAIAFSVGAVINPAHMSEIKEAGKNQGKLWSLINESHDHMGYVSPECGRLGVKFIEGYPCVTSNIPLENTSGQLLIPISGSTPNELVKSINKISEQIFSSRNEDLTRIQFSPCEDIDVQRSVVKHLQTDSAAIVDMFADCCRSAESAESAVIGNSISRTDEQSLPVDEAFLNNAEMTQDEHFLGEEVDECVSAEVIEELEQRVQDEWDLSL